MFAHHLEAATIGADLWWGPWLRRASRAHARDPLLGPVVLVITVGPEAASEQMTDRCDSYSDRQGDQTWNRVSADEAECGSRQDQQAADPAAHPNQNRRGFW